jgi:hypothetical protein
MNFAEFQNNSDVPKGGRAGRYEVWRTGTLTSRVADDPTSGRSEHAEPTPTAFADTSGRDGAAVGGFP